METQEKVCAALVLALIGFTADAPAALAQEITHEEELARQLLAVTGAGAMGEQVMTQMIQAFQSSNPTVSHEFWDQFLAQVDLEELVELVVPVYVKHFTPEEMEATISFYSTPIGQSMLQKMPVVLQESMQAGQQWGLELGKRIAEELEAYREPD